MNLLFTFSFNVGMNVLFVLCIYNKLQTYEYYRRKKKTQFDFSAGSIWVFEVGIRQWRI